MKTKRTKAQTPPRSVLGEPPSCEAFDTKWFVWVQLAPRLLHPSKLAFIQALLAREEPLTLRELAKAAEISEEHARYQCEAMQRAGVLEVVAGAAGNVESSYYFPKPLKAASSLPPKTS